MGKEGSNVAQSSRDTEYVAPTARRFDAQIFSFQVIIQPPIPSRASQSISSHMVCVLLRDSEPEPTLLRCTACSHLQRSIVKGTVGAMEQHAYFEACETTMIGFGSSATPYTARKDIRR